MCQERPSSVDIGGHQEIMKNPQHLLNPAAVPVRPVKANRVSETRKIRKPLMEKRRRARINDCLEELKRMLLDHEAVTGQTTTARPTKLEKADILELTVRHVRRLQEQSSRCASGFREGFSECAREVQHELSRVCSSSGGDERQQGVRERLGTHLAQCLDNLTPPHVSTLSPPLASNLSPPHVSELSVDEDVSNSSSCISAPVSVSPPPLVNTRLSPLMASMTRTNSDARPLNKSKTVVTSSVWRPW